MLVSPKPISRDLERTQSKASTPTVVIPLVLVCLAVALILISAFLIPASLQTPGIESFMVGP
jgi:hypothetical protein